MQLRRRDPALATPEGVFARAVLLIPLLILGGRSVWLYAPDALFFMTLSLIGYLGLRQAIVASAADGRWRGLLESGAVLLAGISSSLAFSALIDAAGIVEVVKIPLTVAVFAGLLLDLSTISAPRRGDYRNAAAIIATVAILLNLAAFGGFWNALACLALGIATLVHGYAAKSRIIFLMGMLAALAGLGFAAQGALAAFTIGAWSALVLLGIATIIAGSVVERHGARIKAGLSDWYQHFDTDDREY